MIIQSSPEGVIRIQTGVVTPGNEETHNGSPEGAKDQNNNQYNQMNP